MFIYLVYLFMISHYNISVAVVRTKFTRDVFFGLTSGDYCISLWCQLLSTIIKLFSLSF